MEIKEGKPEPAARAVVVVRGVAERAAEVRAGDNRAAAVADRLIPANHATAANHVMAANHGAEVSRAAAANQAAEAEAGPLAGEAHRGAAREERRASARRREGAKPLAERNLRDG